MPRAFAGVRWITAGSDGIHGLEFKLDFLPGFAGHRQLWTPLGSFADDVVAFTGQVAAFVPGLNTSFQGDTVGSGTGSIPPRVTQGAATKLQHGIITKDFHQGRHVPDMNPTGSNGHDPRHRSPILGEVDAARLVLLNIVFPQQIDEAHGNGAIAFQFANHGSGVDVVSPGHPQTLGQNPEVHPVVLLPVDDSVHGAVDVQQHAVVAAPLSQTGVGGEASGQVVVHDDWHFQFFGELGPLEHFIDSASGAVQVVAFDFAGFCLGFVNRISYKQEAIAQRWKG